MFMWRSILLLLLIPFVSWQFLVSCEPDDVCTEVRLTPQMQVKFVDNTNRTLPKIASDLQINYITTSFDETLSVTNISVSTDSLAVALPSFGNRAIYTFTQYYNSENNIANTDTIFVDYRLESEYINRACGFRNTYKDVVVTTPPTSQATNWIKDIEVIFKEIEDEEQAHLVLYH